MKVDEQFLVTDEQKFETVLFDDNGNQVADVKEAYAKTNKEEGRPVNNYRLVNRSEPVDPLGRYRNPEFKFRRVEQLCFDNYVQYLKTKEDRFLRFARRYIDG